jgi:hypothetical protein
MFHGLAVPDLWASPLGSQARVKEGLFDRDGAGIRVQEDRRGEAQYGLVVANGKGMFAERS